MMTLQSLQADPADIAHDEMMLRVGGTPIWIGDDCDSVLRRADHAIYMEKRNATRQAVKS